MADEIKTDESPQRRDTFTGYDEINEGEKSCVSYVSTKEPDTYEEVILPDSMDFSRYGGRGQEGVNSTVNYGHQYGMFPIGTCGWIKPDSKGIIAKTFFSQKTQAGIDAFNLVTEAALRGWSIGFWPKETVRLNDDHERFDALIKQYKLAKDGYDAIVTKGLLAEYSLCNLQSNPGAVLHARDIVKSPEFLARLEVEELAVQVKFLHNMMLMLKTSQETIESLSDIQQRPFPNEHSCRLEDPGKFDKFARKTCEQKHEGKCIDIVYGIKEGKSKIQALRYKTKIWTAGDAKAHCKSREGSFEPAKESKSENEFTELKQKVTEATHEIRTLHAEILTLKQQPSKKLEVSVGKDGEYVRKFLERLDGDIRRLYGRLD